MAKTLFDPLIQSLHPPIRIPRKTKKRSELLSENINEDILVHLEPFAIIFHFEVKGEKYQFDVTTFLLILQNRTSIRK